MSGKGALDKDLSRLLLRVRFSLIYIVDLFLGSGLLSSFLQVMPNLLLEPEKMTMSTGVETDGQPKVRRAVVTKSLVLLAAGFSLTSLKQSTVVVEVGS